MPTKVAVPRIGAWNRFAIQQIPSLGQTGRWMGARGKCGLSLLLRVLLFVCFLENTNLHTREGGVKP